jgi:Zn-finger nucleic acid-binding protein
MAVVAHPAEDSMPPPLPAWRRCPDGGSIHGMTQTTQLTCPKCHGAMASYERAGIVVDQCRDCRGIFLDRGELERLLDLEGGAVAPPAPTQPDPQWSGAAPDRSWRPEQPQYQQWQGGSRHDWDDDSDSDRGPRGGSHGSHRKPKKKGSLLREFLDFG